jgi:GNAT superfamily N-acetyltransferase
MLTFRTFCNADPPVLAALWRSRTGQPGLLQPVSPDVLEQLVFAKLYFDCGGLVLAFDDGRPVGFAHAGFGPNAAANWISTESGVTCVTLVRPDCAEAEVAAGLLDHCEDYLRRRGARVLYGGGVGPLNPFYIGLYGGSELPGVLDCDRVTRAAFAARGYQEVERTSLFRRDLSGFELPIDRRQMQVRRQMIVEVTADAPTRTWWEACTIGGFDLTRFDLAPRGGGTAVATATFRSLEPSGTATIGRAVGLVSLSVDESYRCHGLAMFLLSEAFRQFLRQGIMRVEVQTRSTNAAALGTFRKLGFQPAGEGGVWRKDSTPPSSPAYLSTAGAATSIDRACGG